jgi:hypothetical protein
VLPRTRGARNAQGEYPEVAGTPGAWFRARLMERGGPAGEARRRPQTTEASVVRGYELLADTVDETGAPVVLSASSIVETDCPVLGSPVLELATRPEVLTNGRRVIGYQAFAAAPSDAA